MLYLLILCLLNRWFRQTVFVSVILTVYLRIYVSQVSAPDFDNYTVNTNFSRCLCVDPLTVQICPLFKYFCFTNNNLFFFSVFFFFGGWGVGVGEVTVRQYS